MVRLESVSKSYRNGSVPVLRDLSMTLEPSELVMIVGRSGSGKSTLLNLVAGLDWADSGRIEVCGTQLSRHTGAERMAQFRLQTVGIVFQFFNLLPTLSVIENVAIPAYLAGVARKDARVRAERCLAEVDLSFAASRLPHEISGGEMQRAAIARALINDPRLIVADEPTGNLDSENGALVLALFRRVVRERSVSVLTVTHDPALLPEADRILSLHHGSLHPSHNDTPA